MLVLSDDETVVVGKAFDRAWDSFLKKGLLTRHNFHESRCRLAERILRSALDGERDEWRLARDAVNAVQGAATGTPPALRRRWRKRLQRRRGSVGARQAAAPGVVPQIIGGDTPAAPAAA